MSESFLPTYASTFIAVGLTGGLVTVSGFVMAMLPMVAVFTVISFIYYGLLRFQCVL